MLLEFTVRNFRSFYGEASFSMEATPLKSEDPAVDDSNVVTHPDLDILRVAGLYGANASGKSNLVRAMATMARLITDSARAGQAGDTLKTDPFRLAAASLSEPTMFECVWLMGATQYRYGFEYNATAVLREWLHRRPAGKAKEHRLFSRDGDTYTRPHKDLQGSSAIQARTRTNALHLSVCAQLAVPLAEQILGWWRRHFIVAHGLHSMSSMLQDTLRGLDDPSRADAIRSMVRGLDTGVMDVRSNPIDVDDATLNLLPAEVRDKLRGSKTRELVTVHRRTDGAGGPASDVEFELDAESDGTTKLIALAGPLTKALLHGATLIVDEFDARLHPRMSRELVRLFQRQESNPHNAQLVFATHDTGLLDRCLLRRDQYWFAEKSSATGATALYSLAEFEGEDGKRVRNDARLERDYRRGRFGAVPHVGRLQAAITEAVQRAAEQTSAAPQEAL